MKYLGWSFADLMVCPVDYLEVIVEMSQIEAAEARAAQRGF